MRKRRALKITAVSSVALLLAAQIVPYGRDHSNPKVIAEPSWNSRETRNLAERACFACHSNLTKWPWYSNIAPISWLTQHDVEEGRQVLNFSNWPGRSKPVDEMVEEIEGGEMPPQKYRLLHKEARLSKAERQALVDGLKATERSSSQR